MSKRLKYFLLLIGFTALEVLIALFVHDNFVRPYVGDVLVVLVVYCFVRMLFPIGIKALPLYVFLFAAAVEISQYFKLAEALGFGDNRLISTILGSTFDIKDIICYAVGCLLIALAARLGLDRKS